jgi:hypothetical protein
MGILDWVVVSIGLLIGVIGTARLPRIWRDDWKRLPRKAPLTWPYGQALWRGFVRAGAVGGPAALVLVLTLLSERIDFGGAVEPILDVLVHILAPIVIIGGATIILFNWPKQFVPPHLRSEPGAVTEWRGRPRSPTRDGPKT